MIMIYFQKYHSLTATRIFERVIAEGMQYAIALAVEGENDFMRFHVYLRRVYRLHQDL